MFQLDYGQHIPAFLHPWIAKIKDVPRDGHCGFKCIALAVGLKDKDFKDGAAMEVRKALSRDLYNQKDRYSRLIGGEVAFKEACAMLLVEKDAKFGPEKWLSKWSHGQVIANLYERVVLFIQAEPSECTTFLPCGTPYPSKYPPIVLVWVNRNHWVLGYVAADQDETMPFPPVSTSWMKSRSMPADFKRPWIGHVKDGIEKWEELVKEDEEQ